MQSVGKKLTKGLTLPILGIGVAATKTFADFEQELAKVRAVSGASASEFKALRNNAEDLGASTRYAATEVAGLQLNLSKLGFNPGEIISATGGILNLALATGEDLAQSATVAASTLRGFQLEATQTERLVDVMADSFSSSALDLAKFETAMAIVAPVANTAKQSVESTTGMLAVLVNAGIDASTAGTGLRNIFLDIAESGMSLDDALNEILNSSNKNATAMKLFGKRGATVATVLAENVDQAKSFAVQFENSAGAAKRMAGIMDNTLNGSLLKLKSAMESAGIAIGEILAPYIAKLAENASALISRFKDLDAGTQKMIIVISGLVAAVGPLLTALGYLMTNIIPGLIPLFAKLNAVVLANPWTAAAVAIGIVVAALINLNKSAKETVKYQTQLQEVTAKAKKAVAEEREEVEKLFYIARDENVSKAQRIKAIKELNKISPKYLGNLNLEKIKTDEARDAIDKYNESLLKTAKAKAAQEKLQEIQAKIIDKELELSSRRKAIAEQEEALRKGAADNAYQAAVMEKQLANSKAVLAVETKNATKALREQEQALLAIIQANGGLTTGGSGGGVTGDFTGGISNKEAELKALNAELREAQNMGKELQKVFADTGANVDIAKQNAVLESFNNTLNDNYNKWLEIDDNLDPAIESMAQKMERIKEVSKAVGQEVQSAFNSLANGVVDSLGLANDGFQGFVKGLVGTIAKLISMMLAQSISQAIAGATSSGLATGPAAVFTTPGFIATAVGGVLSAFAAIPKFANGGLVSGPTLGLMGEYSGARSNPEVIAPLDKLKGMISDSVGAGNAGGRLTAMVRGRDLLFVLDRQKQYNGRIGS